MLTCGATSGLHVAASTLLNPGEETVVFVESPTYFIAMDILHKGTITIYNNVRSKKNVMEKIKIYSNLIFKSDMKFRIVPVPMERDGVDASALEKTVEAEYAKVSVKNIDSNKNRFWAMFYTIPTFQNPTGTLLSPEKCRRVIQIARKFDLVKKVLT